MACHRPSGPLTPMAGDTPVSPAASSLESPAAIANENCRESSRRATESQPGYRNAPRAHRSERRPGMAIAISCVEVLRLPFDSPNTHQSSLAVAAMSRGCASRWARSETPTTTQCARATLRRSNASFWHRAGSRRPRRGANCGLRIHQGLLQPAPPPLLEQVSFTDRSRAPASERHRSRCTPACDRSRRRQGSSPADPKTGQSLTTAARQAARAGDERMALPRAEPKNGWKQEDKMPPHQVSLTQTLTRPPNRGRSRTGIFQLTAIQFSGCKSPNSLLQ